MDNTPQIADIYRCDWSGKITGDRGTKYFLVLSDIRHPDGWEVWCCKRNRKQIRHLEDYENEFAIAKFSKVA